MYLHYDLYCTCCKTIVSSVLVLPKFGTGTAVGTGSTTGSFHESTCVAWAQEPDPVECAYLPVTRHYFFVGVGRTFSFGRIFLDFLGNS